MYVIGLTGGIGSGKSTVGEHFKQRGIDVIDADIAARRVVEKGTPALTNIANHFGIESLNGDGTLNRAYLRSRVFDNSEERQWLESLLHPLIYQWVKRALCRASSPYIILETPLLLETDQHNLTNRILVVDLPEELQIARAVDRDNNNIEQIRSIMNVQISRKARLSKADDILDNSGPLSCLSIAVSDLHHKYLKLAAEQESKDL